LHNKAEFALAKGRFDRAHDPGPATDRDPLPELERLLATQVSGRDDLVAATQLERYPGINAHASSNVEAALRRIESGSEREKRWERRTL
jgi:hypothetical protein